MKARISKWGNSLAIRIPKALTSEIGIAEGDEVEITVSGNRIVVTPLARHYELDDLVEGITVENRHTETDWGPATGAEVW